MPGDNVLQHFARKGRSMWLGEDGFRVAMRFAVTQKGFEDFAQRAPAAQNARFYRADAALKNFRDLFITEAFEISQDHRAAEHFRNFV